MPDLLRAIEERRLMGPLLYLDGIQNPHNLGAALARCRSCGGRGGRACAGLRSHRPTR
jgi:tRNA G18 (ribose-2'-O)-methylase SpoU